MGAVSQAEIGGGKRDMSKVSLQTVIEWVKFNV